MTDTSSSPDARAVMALAIQRQRLTMPYGDGSLADAALAALRGAGWSVVKLEKAGREFGDTTTTADLFRICAGEAP